MYKYIRGGGKNPSQTSLAELRFNSVTSPPPPLTTSERPLPIRLEATVSVGRKEIVPTAPAFFFFVRNKCFNSCHLGLDCSRAANRGTDRRAVQNARAKQHTHTQKSSIESWSGVSRCCNSFPFDVLLAKRKRDGLPALSPFSVLKRPDTRISHTFVQATYAHASHRATSQTTSTVNIYK